MPKNVFVVVHTRRHGIPFLWGKLQACFNWLHILGVVIFEAKTVLHLHGAVDVTRLFLHPGIIARGWCADFDAAALCIGGGGAAVEHSPLRVADARG